MCSFVGAQNAMRRVVNLRLVGRIQRCRGCRIFLEGRSLAEQARLFSNSSLVIQAHGAALGKTHKIKDLKNRIKRKRFFRSKNSKYPHLLVYPFSFIRRTCFRKHHFKTTDSGFCLYRTKSTNINETNTWSCSRQKNGGDSQASISSIVISNEEVLSSTTSSSSLFVVQELSSMKMSDIGAPNCKKFFD